MLSGWVISAQWNRLITGQSLVGERETSSARLNGVPYLFSHQPARILIFEEVPVSKHRVSNHFGDLLVDSLKVEAFCIRWSISDI